MKPKLTKCPICDFNKLKLVRSDFAVTRQGRAITIPKLERYECPRCGEVLFDYEGAKRLEQARPPRRKLSKAG